MIGCLQYGRADIDGQEVIQAQGMGRFEGACALELFQCPGQTKMLGRPKQRCGKWKYRFAYNPTQGLIAINLCTVYIHDRLKDGCNAFMLYDILKVLVDLMVPAFKGRESLPVMG